MFSRIVIGLDGSDHSLRAVAWVGQICPDHSARIDVLHVREMSVGHGLEGQPAEPDEDQIVARVEGAADSLAALGYGVHLRYMSTITGEPARLIADAAKEVGAEVIVVATRGRGPVAGLLLGSVAQRLLHLAPCPVLAIPAGARTPRSRGSE